MTPRRHDGTKRDERGFTLIEMLVAATLSTIVLAVAGNGLINLTRTSAIATTTAHSAEAATAALDALATDLRSTHQLTAESATSLTVVVNTASGGTSTVTWTASGTSPDISLTRSVGAVSTTELTGLVSTNVFTYDSGVTSLTGQAVSNVLACATLVDVTLTQGAPDGGTPYTDTESLALSDPMEQQAIEGGTCS